MSNRVWQSNVKNNFCGGLQAPYRLKDWYHNKTANNNVYLFRIKVVTDRANFCMYSLYKWIFARVNIPSVQAYELSLFMMVGSGRNERESGNEAATRVQNQMQRRTQTRDECRSRGECRSRRRSRSLEKPVEFSAMNKTEKRARTRWGSRCLMESAQRRVRVVTIATRTQPRRGAHLAPLTPLVRAPHARMCWKYISWKYKLCCSYVSLKIRFRWK